MTSASTWVTKQFPYYCGNCGLGRTPEQIKIGGAQRLFCAECGKQVRQWPRKTLMPKTIKNLQVTGKMLIQRTCPTCRRVFYVLPSNAVRGKGKFCCRTCAGTNKRE